MTGENERESVSVATCRNFNYSFSIQMPRTGINGIRLGAMLAKRLWDFVSCYSESKT